MTNMNNLKQTNIATTTVKKYAVITFFAVVVISSMCSCQESKRERLEREAKEYTEKNCPCPIVQDIIYLDSLVCHNDGNNDYIYYYSVKGDSAMYAEMNSKYKEGREALLKSVRNSVDLRFVKAEGLNIIYSYYDATTHHKIQEYVFTPKDYN